MNEMGEWWMVDGIGANGNCYADDEKIFENE